MCTPGAPFYYYSRFPCGSTAFLFAVTQPRVWKLKCVWEWRYAAPGDPARGPRPNQGGGVMHWISESVSIVNVDAGCKLMQRNTDSRRLFNWGHCCTFVRSRTEGISSHLSSPVIYRLVITGMTECIEMKNYRQQLQTTQDERRNTF